MYIYFSENTQVEAVVDLILLDNRRRCFNLLVLLSNKIKLESTIYDFFDF